MISRKGASVQTRAYFVLALAAALSTGGRAMAARMNAERVFESTKGVLDPHGFRAIRSVYPARDGTVWVIGVDWVLSSAGAHAWFVRRLSSDGAALGKEFSLFPGRGLMDIGSVIPVGTAPDGSLIANVEEATAEGGQRLAKISPTGSMSVTEILPLHDPYKPFVDRDGVAHVVSVSLGHVDYVQVNMTARGLPVVRALSYDQPFDGLESVPGYLRWGGQLAFFSDVGKRLLVATRRVGHDGPRFRLCRIDSKTLALVDTGSIDVYQDTFRTWSGPVFPIPRLAIVPSDKSGYWLFVTTPDTPPSPTVFAYRIGADLKAIRPSGVGAGVAKPFAATPPDAHVVVMSSFKYKERWEDGVRVVPAELSLTFVAFGRDGQLYTQTYDDSMTSRITK